MKSVLSKTFTTELVLERSSTPIAQSLGTHESTMELWVYEGGHGMIEWDVPDLGDTWHIGLWWDENKVLRDYDGVFSLPHEAVELLEEYGIKVGEDFR